MQDPSAVIFSNDTFYAAFSGKDMKAMANVWWHGETISCIHPGWPPLFGRKNVLASWRAILSSENSPDIQSQNAVAHLFNDTAYVVCHEIVGTHALLATNVFTLDSGRWHMVHHQGGASAPLPREETRTNVNRLH